MTEMPGGQAGGAELALLLLRMLENEHLNAVVEGYNRVAYAQRRCFSAALAFDHGSINHIVFHMLHIRPRRRGFNGDVRRRDESIRLEHWKVQFACLDPG